MELINIIFLSISLGLGLIFSILELIFAFCFKEKLRSIFKCLASGMVIFAVISINPLNYLIYIAAIFAVIGDFFLLFKIDESKIKALIAGGVFFALMHITLFISENKILSEITAIPVYFYLIAVILIFGGIALSVIFIKKFPVALRVGIPAYLSTILLNIAFLITLTFLSNDLRYLIIVAGYLMFLFSDSLILYGNVTHKIKHQHFWVMLTYLIALYTILITLSFILINLPIII